MSVDKYLSELRYVCLHEFSHFSFKRKIIVSLPTQGWLEEIALGPHRSKRKGIGIWAAPSILSQTESDSGISLLGFGLGTWLGSPAGFEVGEERVGRGSLL